MLRADSGCLTRLDFRVQTAGTPQNSGTSTPLRHYAQLISCFVFAFTTSPFNLFTRLRTRHNNLPCSSRFQLCGRITKKHCLSESPTKPKLIETPPKLNH